MCPAQVGQRQWERVLEMVGRIRGLGMEVCTTLGMLTPEQVTCAVLFHDHHLCAMCLEACCSMLHKVQDRGCGWEEPCQRLL